MKSGQARVIKQNIPLQSMPLMVVGALLYTKEETFLMLMSFADFQVMMLLQLQVEIRELYQRAVRPTVGNSMNSKGYTEGSH
jgi:hypothetical protein